MLEYLNTSLQSFSRNLRSQTNGQLLLFFTSLSPLFIGTILFHYLDSELGVPLDEILRVSAIYAMMPLFFDVPMGMIADRCGVKTTLYGGLGCYFLSICAILLLPPPWSYHLYFLFSKLGFPCISGADFSLIRQQVAEREEDGFKSTIYYLQKWSYLINASVSLITPFIYTYSKKLPFILQLILLALSMINLSTMRETRGKIRQKRKRFISDFILCMRLCTLNRKYLLLLICGAVFGLGVALNQTVIQHQLTQHLSVSIAYGTIFAASNLFSALGTTALARGLRGMSFEKQITTLLIMDVFAFLAMGSNHIYAVIMGFLMVNLFKGGFRPLINAELTNKMPFQRLTAQALSFASFTTALFVNVSQWALAGQYRNGSKGHLIYALIATLCVFSALVWSTLHYCWTVFERKSRQRIKKSQLICIDGAYRLVQTYQAVDRELFADMKWAGQEQIYPTPLISLRSTPRATSVEMAFLSDIKLGDLRDRHRQFAMCRDLLKAHKERRGFQRCAKLPRADTIFTDEIAKILTLAKKGEQEIDLHGQLDPANLIICGNQLFAVNWSRCGKGVWWWDPLTLLAHPYLHLPLSWRASLLAQWAPKLAPNHCTQILEQFANFQIQQLLCSNSAKDQELARRYTKMVSGSPKR